MDRQQAFKIADIELSPRLVAYFTLFFVVLAIHPRVITLAYLFLMAWSLKGAKQSLQSITLSAIIRFLNPALFDKPPEIGVLSVGLTIVVGVRLLLFLSPSSRKIVGSTLVFFIAVTLFSFLNSPDFAVSFMKISVFSFTFAAVIAGFFSLEKDEIINFEIWLFHLIFAVAFLSLFTFLRPGVGYNRTEEGFQGILCHPQAFGIILAPFACYLLSQLISGVNIKKLLTTLAFICLFALIILSGARTGIVSILLALSLSYFVGIFFYEHPIKLDTRYVLIIFIVIMLCTPLLLYSFSKMKPAAETFVLKGEGSSISESFYDSRGRGIESQWENFLKHPFIGNGFGVYASGYFPRGVYKVWGIPISASVEKGFLPTAILEETGLIGALLFLVLLISIARQAVNNESIVYLCVFFSSLFVNLGEMVFFSVNGLGSFFWILIGLSCVAGKNSHNLE
ncbi:MAG: O-antigen ligase domain-containing protein [Methanosarcinales archaeon]|nr:MAG: O-antigen ligase domain-containing protein [Methanosarcinales archaeon]